MVPSVLCSFLAGQVLGIGSSDVAKKRKSQKLIQTPKVPPFYIGSFQYVGTFYFIFYPYYY